MRRLLRKVTAAGILVVLALGTFTWSVWQRWDGAVASVSIANLTDSAQVVRLTDATSGRSLRTVRIEPGTRPLVARQRLDVWWRDPTIPERAAGAERGVRLELLGADCSLLATQVVDHWDGLMSLEPGEGFIAFMPEDGQSIQEPVGTATPVPDPCEGGPATPVAVIQNQHTRPVVLEGRIRVEACARLILRQGDAAQLLPASAMAGATRVELPSLAVQKARWPLETRAVTLGLEVEDYAGQAFPYASSDECEAAVGSAATP